MKEEHPSSQTSVQGEGSKRFLYVKIRDTCVINGGCISYL